MNTKISIKFKRGVAVVLPNGSTVQPTLIPKTKVVPGFSAPVPIQVHDLDYVHTITLLNETPTPLPDYISTNPELKKSFEQNQAQALAAANASNNQARHVLEQLQKKGDIEILHDSFKDGGESPEQESTYQDHLHEDSMAVQNELKAQYARYGTPEFGHTDGNANLRAKAERDASEYPTSVDTDKQAADAAKEKAAKISSKAKKAPAVTTEGDNTFVNAQPSKSVPVKNDSGVATNAKAEVTTK